MKQYLPTILRVAFGVAVYSAMQYFGILSGWPNIPVGPVTLPVSGETVQSLLGISAFLLPSYVGRVQWIDDAWAAPGRIRELHSAKPVLVNGAMSAVALGNTGTVVTQPVEAVKPAGDVA
jgi:hypothetical protein